MRLRGARKKPPARWLALLDSAQQFAHHDATRPPRRGNHMRGNSSATSLLATITVLFGCQLVGCEQAKPPSPSASASAQDSTRYGSPSAGSAAAAARKEPWSYQDWPTGAY